MLSLAREILGAIFNGAFRAFFVPGPTLPLAVLQTIPTGLYT
jgi:hypothetical protein